MTASGSRERRTSPTAGDAVGMSVDRLPQVWIFQPSIKHYRLPVWDLLSERAADRYEITVFGPLDVDHAQIESRPYLQAMPLRKRLLWGREFAHWGGAARMIRHERPEVVVLTASVALLGSWTLPRLARRCGAAVVGWSKVNSRTGHVSWPERQLKRQFFRRFDLFLCYGQCSREELTQIGYPRDRVRVAQNTINTHRIFEKEELILARGEELRRDAGITGKKVLLCIGRMVPQKRHADLISAWLDLRDVDPDLVLVFVGKGPLLDGLQTAAAETDSKRIIFTGAAAEGDDYAWVATSDLVVIPGAVGLALNQSLGFGRPTIIADEPGADAELLQHGVTGWRYPRGDIEALVKTVRDVLRNRSAAAQVGRQAREVIRQRATIEQMVETIDQTLAEALAISKSRSRSR